MDGTEDDEIYWDEESDFSEDTGYVENEEDTSSFQMTLLIMTVTKSSWPSMMCQYHKFVTSK